MTMRLTVALATGLTQTGTRKLEALELLEVSLVTEDEAWHLADQQPVSSFLTHGLLHLHRHRTRRG
jgi:hypothetical protein